ncbi:Crp/Fnr family transcriptional regulator [Gehongia tenuis]|uniref:Crp/Fnr family transcriptional regulator n=1 Tax=Gehongia tenuis TaxID=2763655 RepID=A0A926D237_9FIRM|nr:Crp/Fnr family transcriptional regulator [Gehongia tenuis]MBC8530333.1 Crp/Fnr family transcriptional regulator [Gehongia tenuis]
MGKLQRAGLFAGLEEGACRELLQCLGARTAHYGKGEFIITEGDEPAEFGVLLSGRARAVKWDPSGRLIILTLLERGSELGVMLAASGGRRSPVTVVAEEDASAVWIACERLLSRCEKACRSHEQLLRNYIRAVAEKGLVLHERIDCLLRPTLREKIMAYLTRMAGERGRKFTLPLNRNAMAEYLNVDRSALSRELSRMAKDGMIKYHRNDFELL